MPTKNINILTKDINILFIFFLCQLWVTNEVLMATIYNLCRVRHLNNMLKVGNSVSHR